MKLWFKQKISKEEFDLEAHRLLTQDNGRSSPSFPRFAISIFVFDAVKENLNNITVTKLTGETGRERGKM